jgi:hypothetical protein
VKLIPTSQFFEVAKRYFRNSQFELPHEVVGYESKERRHSAKSHTVFHIAVTHK